MQQISSSDVLYSTGLVSLSNESRKSHASFSAWCPIEPSDFPKKSKIIAAIYIVTSLLSIFGASSVLIYAITKKIVRNPEVRPLFHLALADLLLAVLWFSGACLWFAKNTNCFELDVVAEMAHLASFFLTVNYGFNAYLRLKEKTYNVSNLRFLTVTPRINYSILLKASYVVCWFVPVVIMLPLLIEYKTNDSSDVAKTYRLCSRCLLLFDRPKLARHGKRLSENLWFSYGSIALTAALSFSIVALTLLYFMMLRVYRKAVIYSGVMTDRQRCSIDTIRNRIFLYITVFLFCWSPALVVATADLDPNIHNATRLPGWYILFVFQGLTPMQGFLNCIVYGWTRKSFREASGRQRLLRESDEFDTSGRIRTNSYGSLASL